MEDVQDALVLAVLRVLGQEVVVEELAAEDDPGDAGAAVDHHAERHQGLGRRPVKMAWARSGP